MKNLEIVWDNMSPHLGLRKDPLHKNAGISLAYHNSKLWIGLKGVFLGHRTDLITSFIYTFENMY